MWRRCDREREDRESPFLEYMRAGREGGKGRGVGRKEEMGEMEEGTKDIPNGKIIGAALSIIRNKQLNCSSSQRL